MASCKDCIQYDVCEYADNLEYADVESLKSDCPRFQNKADFVKVVRCKDCKYCNEYRKFNSERYLGCNTNGEIYEVEPNHFCSFGEKRDGVI